MALPLATFVLLMEKFLMQLKQKEYHFEEEL